MDKYVKLISEKTGQSTDRVFARMKKINSIYGITYREYYNNEMYDMPEGALEKEAFKLQTKKERRKEAFDFVISDSGLSRKEILADIKRINDRGIIRINIFFYEKFQLYKLTEDELKKTLVLLKKRDLLNKEILEDLETLGKGERTYKDIEGKIKEFTKVIDSLMSHRFYEKLKTLYDKGRNCQNQEAIDAVLVDMEVTRLLLGFSFNEYMAFHFDEKTFMEKIEYMSNRERMAVLSQYNDEQGCNLLNNKAECYRTISKAFGRKQIYIKDSDNIKLFKRFCRRRNSFVKKDLAKSMGKGVEPIYIDRGTDLDKLFHRLLDESGSFVAEEMIKQHESMKVFNPSSVNTVRIETFFDGHSVELVDAFIRFGQTGAFVDNAGAGGIFVSVDPETGTLRGHGFDELGKVYETHPQSGLVFKGHELNDWDKAIKLAKSIGNKFSGVSFIGWDIAYTESGKWVVVEGNAKPQIICNQTSQGRGLKQEFLKKTKYSEK